MTLSPLKNQSPILLGGLAPDFSAQTSEGTFRFYDWLGDSWCIFFSHPKDFTPVCTTELGQTARLKAEFDKRNVKVLALSVDSMDNHKKWIQDINETQHVKVNFPLIADMDRKIAYMYGMIHPEMSETTTVRSVFIIDPNKKVRLTMTYPSATGRNFNEILRTVDAIQLTDNASVATPEGWKWGEDCIILPNIIDPAELKKKFPKGWKELKPYLRLTPQP